MTIPAPVTKEDMEAFCDACVSLRLVWERRLGELGIAIESTVKWERGGTSLYFRDLDHHLVELITPGCWAVY